MDVCEEIFWNSNILSTVLVLSFPTVQQSAATPGSDSVVRLKTLLRNVSMKSDLQGRVWEIPKTGLQAKSQLTVEI